MNIRGMWPATAIMVLALCGCHRSGVPAPPPPPQPQAMRAAHGVEAPEMAAAAPASEAGSSPAATYGSAAPPLVVSPGSSTPPPKEFKRKPVVPAAGIPPAASADEKEEAWFAALKPGRVDWDVPPEMVVNVKRLMTIRVHGYEDVANAGDALPNATGAAPLKVSTQMSAELVSANGDLTVVPLDKASQKYVPATGFTDWTWDVTPVHSGKGETLRLTLYVILDEAHRRPFVSYSKPFTIKVASAGSAKNYVEENFSSLLKYWGPGGAGFLAVAGVIAWWRKRSQKGSTTAGASGG